MIYDIANNTVHCSKCGGLCISKAKQLLMKMGSPAAYEFIEPDDYDLYVCKKCGYKDYIDEEK